MRCGGGSLRAMACRQRKLARVAPAHPQPLFLHVRLLLLRQALQGGPHEPGHLVQVRAVLAHRQPRQLLVGVQQGRLKAPVLVLRVRRAQGHPVRASVRVRARPRACARPPSRSSCQRTSLMPRPTPMGSGPPWLWRRQCRARGAAVASAPLPLPLQPVVVLLLLRAGVRCVLCIHGLGL